jgi:hypothetical protein
VTAAIIELDPLADAVRAAAEDDHLVPAVRVRLAGRLERAVQIRRKRLELGRARIDALVNRLQSLRGAPPPHVRLLRAQGERELLVAEAGALQPPKLFRVDAVEPAVRRGAAHRRKLAELPQEPRIDSRDLVEVLGGPAAIDRAEEIPHPPIGRNRQALPQRRVVLIVRARGREQEAAPTELERSNALHERFLEGAADSHHFADRFHLRGQRAIRLRKFFEIPARDLDYDVVDGRLERGGREAGDVVRDLVEVIAQGELRRDLRDREPGRLRRQGGRPRDTRVHFDHDHASGCRIDGKLNIRPAGLDADATDDSPRRVAHALIFLVAERQDGRDRDAVAGVHAHRIDVLDRADDDEVVGDVAHHLELEFLPADDRFFDENLMHRAELEAALREVAELLDVVGDPAAHAAERKRRTDDQREPERPRKIDRFRRRPREAALRHVEADLAHRVLEQETILGDLDRFDRCADQLDVVLVERAGGRKIHGEVERRLAADRRQDCVGPFALDDRGQHFRRQRLDIGAVRELRVGHDRRRVAVDEDHFEPLGAQRLARLAP